MSTRRSRRVPVSEPDAPDEFRRQHGGIARRIREHGDEVAARYANAAESPLAWLARRKDKDGGRLIDSNQLAAGERLRADFTRAGLTPRVTANWIAPVAQGRRGGDGEGTASFA